MDSMTSLKQVREKFDPIPPVPTRLGAVIKIQGFKVDLDVMVIALHLN